ncbi:MAG TPA: hypothetical protein VGN42_00890 [Pirellulales bacterium]|nr:hypothetical protein [Pirellulales bacterium]
MTLPLRKKHPITAPNTVRAISPEAAEKPRGGPSRRAAAMGRGLRRAACCLSLGLGAALAAGDLSADVIEGRSGQANATWSTTKTKPAATVRANSNRLKWRAPNSARSTKQIEPRPLEQTLGAAPALGIELRPATGVSSDAAGAAQRDAGGEEREVILLTTGEEPIVDPFDDPFEDRKPRPKPAELRLFPVITAAKLQPVEAEDDQPPPPPSDLEAPDEAPENAAPPEEMPAEEMPADERPTDVPAPKARAADDGSEMMLPSDDEFAQSPEIREDKCPTPRDLKPISEISNKIAAEPGIFPQECMLSDEPFQPRNFAKTTFTWKASALCHKPLYFEQVGVERYGHTWGPFLQPVVSSAHFFGSVIMLPYKMGVEPPWECVYALGYYRPGSCAPYTVGPVPISLRGALTQTGATLGFVYIFAP